MKRKQIILVCGILIFFGLVFGIGYLEKPSAQWKDAIAALSYIHFEAGALSGDSYRLRSDMRWAKDHYDAITNGLPVPVTPDTTGDFVARVYKAEGSWSQLREKIRKLFRMESDRVFKRTSNVEKLQAQKDAFAEELGQAQKSVQHFKDEIKQYEERRRQAIALFVAETRKVIDMRCGVQQINRAILGADAVDWGFMRDGAAFNVSCLTVYEMLFAIEEGDIRGMYYVDIRTGKKVRDIDPREELKKAMKELKLSFPK